MFDDFEESYDVATDLNEKKHLHRDANYVNWRLLIEKKKVEKLEERLRLCRLSVKSKNKHIFFVDDVKNKPVVAQTTLFKTDADEISRIKQELKERRHQLKELLIVSAKLAVQKEILVDKNDNRELIRPETTNHAAVYKWKPMRKK